MNPLGIGSLVRLKSGGPLMTAVEFPKQGVVVCAWIWEGEPRQASYPEIALEVLVREEQIERALSARGQAQRWEKPAEEEG